MNRQIAKIRNQDQNAREQSQRVTRSILETNQINDYNYYLAQKLKSQRKQKELSQVYKQASPQRNTNALSSLESKKTSLLSSNETDKGFLNSLANATIKERRDFDIDPNRGYLAHFFRRDADPETGNVGRAFLNKALDKQKKFDQIFLKHIMDGEKAYQERIHRKRSTSVAKSHMS